MKTRGDLGTIGIEKNDSLCTEKKIFARELCLCIHDKGSELTEDPSKIIPGVSPPAVTVYFVKECQYQAAQTDTYI